MRAKNHIKRHATMKLYTWTTFCCPRSGKLGECHVGETDSGTLPEDVFEAVTAGHDVTIVVIPKLSVAVYAKSEEYLERFEKLVNKDYVRRLLSGNCHEHEDLNEAHYYWGTYDFPV